MTRIHINIGSNKGDRAALIERAVALIAYSLDPAALAEIRLAPLVESAPGVLIRPILFSISA